MATQQRARPVQNILSAPPPSLQNIFKEIEADSGHPVSRDPDLSRWARQGVLLLNATLTVREGAAGSHQNKGWEQFTDAARARAEREERDGLAFLLWGNYARRKGAEYRPAKTSCAGVGAPLAAVGA